MLEVKEVFPNVHAIVYEKTYELCMSLVRMQEFYESPQFMGKYFTLEEYMDYWAGTYGGGNFDYTTTWGGFNIPGTVLSEWITLFGTDLRKRELDLILSILDEIPIREFQDKYFIFASEEAKDLDGVLSHEMAHGAYTLYQEYRDSCNGMIRATDPEEVDAARIKLIRMGYDESVVYDEIQAYWSVGPMEKEDNKNPLKPREHFIEHFNEFRKSIEE